MNKKGKLIYENVLDVTKAMLRRKFLLLKANIRKLQKLEVVKEEPIKYNINKKNEIKLRAEINRFEDTKNQ